MESGIIPWQLKSSEMTFTSPKYFKEILLPTPMPVKSCWYCYLGNMHIDVSESPGLSGSLNSINKIYILFWPKMFVVVNLLNKTAGKLT